MKKKILATVLAGAMVATCAASLAACGDSKVSMPKGDEVTDTEWAEFFEKTTEVKNYTLEYSVDSTATIKGTYKAPTGMDITKKKEQTIEGKSKASESGLALYDVENNKAYSETKSSSELSMKGDEDKSTSESEGTEKEYYELKAEKEGVKTYWYADYSKFESSSESPLGKDSKKKEEYWDAYTEVEFAESYIYEIFEGDIYFYESKEENAEEKSILELYEKFTYADGVYTATLYKEVELYEVLELSDIIECTVKVSFNKAEKCVIGYSVKTEGEGNLKIEESNLVPVSYNLDYTYKAESVYSLTNIKSTDVSKKVDKDLTKALDKAKAEEANA
ncbi:MAG: hypothetical protein K2L02_02620 [Clostridia bacterium]|nr:hypothetical protein [Clostridia bacterium]